MCVTAILPHVSDAGVCIAACTSSPRLRRCASRLLLQSCDGWKEVTWNGEKLDVLRARFQSHQRKAAARKAGTAAAAAVRAIGM
jgi:hypothetical protein